MRDVIVNWMKGLDIVSRIIIIKIKQEEIYIMELILLKHFWVAFIFVTFLNAVILKRRAKEYADKNPMLEEGYNKMFLYYITIGNVPWIIMGLGMLTGYTETIIDYFRPRDMNPIVLLFHLSTIIILCVFDYWIFFRNGAEFLSRHPGLFNSNSFFVKNERLTAKQIKMLFGLLTIPGFLALLLMWTSIVPKISL